MPNVPLPFLKQARQRGILSQLKLLGRLFQASRIFLLCRGLNGSIDGTAHYIGLTEITEPDGTCRFICPDYSQQDEFHPFFPYCHPVLIDGEPIHTQLGDEIHLHVNAIKDNGGNPIAALAWTQPKNQTLSQQDLRLLEETCQDIAENLPNHKDRSGTTHQQTAVNETELLQACLEAHQIGYWVMDFNPNSDDFKQHSIYFSDPSRKRGEFSEQVTLHDFIERVHHQDREQMVDVFAQLRQGNRVVTNPFRLTHTNETRHLIFAACPMLNREGKVAQAFGTTQDVTSARKQEQSLVEMNLRFNMSMKMARLFYWVLDNDNVLHWEQPPPVFRGFRRWISKRDTFTYDKFLRFVHPDDRVKVQMALDLSATGKTVSELEYRLLIGKSVRYLATWFYPVMDENGNLIERYGLTQDISDAKRLEAQLRVNNDRFKKSLSLGRMGHWTINFDHKTFEASSELMSMTRLPSKKISLDRLCQQVEPSEQMKIQDAIKHLEQGQEVTLNINLKREQEDLHYLAYGFPVLGKDGKGPAAFGLVQDVSDQKNLETELEETNQWLSKAMTVGQMGYWKIDWSRNVFLVSQAMRKIIGIDQIEIPFETIRSLCLPADLEVFDNSFDNLRLGSEVNSSYRLRIGENTKCIFACGFPIRNSLGIVATAFGFYQDMTDIRILKDRLENYLEAAPSVILALDPDMKITYANPHVQTLLGYAPDDLIGWEVDLAILPERVGSQRAFRDQLKALIVHSNKTYFHSINENICLDDSIVWLSWTTAIRRDEFGRPIEILCIANDITSYHAVQERFDLTVDTSEFGFWDLNLATKEGAATRCWFTVRGLEQQNPLTEELFYNMIHPEDLGIFQEKIREHFEGRTELVEDQFRLYRADTDEWVWIRTKGKITQYDSMGNPLWFSGFEYNVTREILDARNIRNSQNLIQQAMEMGRMAYWVYDVTKKKIVSHSATLFSMLGLADFTFATWNDDLIPFFRRIVHPDDYDFFIENFFREGDTRFTFRGLMPTGMIVYFQLHSSPVYDGNGDTVTKITVIQDITDQKIVESQLVEQEREVREKEMRYRMLYDHSGEAIHVLDNDVITECNLRTLQIFGYDNHDELIGRHPEILTADYQADGQTCSQRLTEVIQRCNLGETCSNDWISRRKDGSTFESTITFIPMLGEGKFIQVVVKDITEQKAAGRALENYRCYVSLLAEIRKSFYSRSEQEIVQTFLETATNFFGLDKAWYGVRIGNTIRPIFHAGKAKGHIDVARVEIEPTTETHCYPLAKAVETGDVCVINHLDQEPGFLPWQEFLKATNFRSVLAIPIIVNGNIEGGVVFYSFMPSAFDESIVDYLNSSLKELVRISTEKRRWTQQQRTLKKAKETAEAAAQAKTQFLANMSHEIRTPMTSILGYTEVLLADHIAKTEGKNRDNLSIELCMNILDHCKSTAKIIQSNAEFLLSILNDILDFSKMEADKMTVEMRDVPISAFLNELSSLYTVQAVAKNLSFCVKALTPLPECMHTDPVRIKQVLINLVGNAIKFTLSGEVTVSVAWVVEERGGIWQRQSITNSNAPGENVVRGNLFFSVKDTGIGIASDHLASLFTPFHQADASTTRRFGGTGLGLAISKRLIQLLGGELTISSREGSGSTFTVMLPQLYTDHCNWKTLEEINEEAQLIPPGQKEAKKIIDEAKKKPLTGLRILLAEDGRDNQRLFSFILEKAGAEVALADNGKIAIELAMNDINNGQKPFDLILMDMQMPIMDGYTATSQLREFGYNYPIVALTAHALVEERQKCLNAGCNDYATKPILRDALIDAILKNIKTENDA